MHTDQQLIRTESTHLSRLPIAKPVQWLVPALFTASIWATLCCIVALSGSAFAGDFEDGLAALERRDYATAHAKWTQAAEQGDALAQYSLGLMYREGEGVPKDDKQAVYWYTKAAEQGEIAAQYELGSLYFYGTGVPKDVEQGLFWYTKAAEQGLESAQGIVARTYAKGEDVPQDWEKAVYWYTRAAEDGSEVAQETLGYMYKNGEGVRQDYEKAFYWFSKSADKWFITSWYELGEMYLAGNGVPKNYVKAYMWFSLVPEDFHGYGMAAAMMRDQLEKAMTAEQIAEAQRLSREWKAR